MIVTLGLVVLLFFASDPAGVVTRHPLAVLLAGLALGAFAVSLRSLNLINRASTPTDLRRPWRVSLLCHAVIVLIIVGSLGVGVGLSLSATEVLAIGVHIYALVTLAKRTPGA